MKSKIAAEADCQFARNKRARTSGTFLSVKG